MHSYSLSLYLYLSLPAVEALEHLQRTNDPAIQIDFVTKILVTPERPQDVLQISLLYPLLLIIKDLCVSSNLDHSVTGFTFLTRLLTVFGVTIRTNARIRSVASKDEKDDKSDKTRAECVRIHSFLLTMKKQVRVESLVREKKRGKVAKDVVEAYKLLN
jgi:hypothetical protein